MAKKEFFYQHILNDISRRIENGEYKYEQLLPSERELAEQYQVNRTTVRKALDLLVQKDYIEKRQGTGSVVSYKGEITPGENEEGKEKTIGFFLPGGRSKDIRLEQPFYMTLYYNIEHLCREQNCRVVCMTVVDLEEFISLTREYKFSAAFFMSKIRGDIVEYAVKAGIPSVAVNEKFMNIPCITMDNVNGGYLATKYLLEKGHSRIAFITGPEKYFTSEDRLLGVKKALNEQQILLEEDNIVMADWTYEGGYLAMQEILNKPQKSWPTAVFAFNEELVRGALGAIKERKLRIPEDISMIGFENALGTKIEDSITMIDSDIRLVAKTATTTLMNLMNHQGFDYAVTILLPVCIVESVSVMNLNRAFPDAE